MKKYSGWRYSESLYYASTCLAFIGPRSWCPVRRSFRKDGSELNKSFQGYKEKGIRKVFQLSCELSTIRRAREIKCGQYKSFSAPVFYFHLMGNLNSRISLKIWNLPMLWKLIQIWFFNPYFLSNNHLLNNCKSILCLLQTYSLRKTRLSKS